jgi:hypothetical protein
MKKNKILNFQVIKLEESESDVRKKYPKISVVIRTADIIGMLRNGTCYILLSQGDKQTSLDVVERLEKLGVKGCLVETNEIPLE